MVTCTHDIVVSGSLVSNTCTRTPHLHSSLGPLLDTCMQVFRYFVYMWLASSDCNPRTPEVIRCTIAVQSYSPANYHMNKEIAQFNGPYIAIYIATKHQLRSYIRAAHLG